MAREFRPNYPASLESIEPGDLVRFAKKIEASRNGSCWNFLGNHDEKGYGRFWLQTRNQWAHRVAYVVFNGPIPAGLTVHHTCHNTSCVNPAHLQLSPLQQNSNWHETRDSEPPF